MRATRCLQILQQEARPEPIFFIERFIGFVLHHELNWPKQVLQLSLGVNYMDVDNRITVI